MSDGPDQRDDKIKRLSVECARASQAEKDLAVKVEGLNLELIRWQARAVVAEEYAEVDECAGGRYEARVLELEHKLAETKVIANMRGNNLDAWHAWATGIVPGEGMSGTARRAAISRLCEVPKDVASDVDISVPVPRDRWKGSVIIRSGCYAGRRGTYTGRVEGSEHCMDVEGVGPVWVHESDLEDSGQGNGWDV